MYTFIMTVVKKDLEIALLTIKQIQNNLEPKKIIVIGNKQLEKEMCNVNPSIIFIDEDKLYKGMSLSRIEDILFNIAKEKKRAGWYFQQFLKMAYATICEEDYYIIWDGDTIPLKHIQFCNLKNGKLLFTMSEEFHQPYFTTLNRLFEGEVVKNCKESFISEHMIIDKNIMIEIINKIENNKALPGDTFYEKILFAIDKEHILKSGFSEFETYGNYVLRFYPNKYEMRKLRTFRRAKSIIGIPNEKQLKWIGDSFDIISIEYWDEVGIGKYFSNIEFIRRHLTFEQFAKLCTTKVGTTLSKCYIKFKKFLD